MRNIKIEDNKFIIEFSYNKDIIDELKLLNFIYNPNDKTWHKGIENISSIKVEKFVSKFNFTVDRSLYDISVFKKHFISNDFKGEIERYNKKYIIPKLDRDNLSKLFKITPRDYQWIACMFMILNKRCILGDDIGLGKTFETIMAIEIEELYPCLIVTPASLKYRWQDEFTLTTDRECFVVDNKLELDKEITIVNYDKLSKYEKELSKMNFKCIVFDESQYIKNSKTKRAKSAKKITNKVEYIFLLSGTLVTKKPIELFNQMCIINREWDFGGWRKFIYSYCGAHKTPFGIEVNGVTKIGELVSKLHKSFYLRREKEDVLKDLPEKQETVIHLDISNKKEYRDLENDFIDFLKENYGQLKADSALKAQAITQQTYLRQCVSRGKLKGIMEWIDDFIESGKSLVIFGIYKDSLLELSKKYKCNRITGDIKAIDRQKYIKSFIEGNEQLICVNIQSGGVGIDGLQKICSDCIIIDIPDLPKDIDQPIGRLHRSGQKNNVNSYLFKCKDTIDDKLYDSLETKRIVTESINKGTSSIGKEVSVIDFYLESI